MLSRMQTKNGAEHMFWIFVIWVLSFVPFSTEERFINNENDPDFNFYNDVFNLDTQLSCAW